MTECKLSLALLFRPWTSESGHKRGDERRLRLQFLNVIHNKFILINIIIFYFILFFININNK